MKNLLKLLSTVSIGIDRITFSIPLLMVDELISRLSTTTINKKEYEWNKYWHKEYYIGDNRIILCAKSFTPDTKTGYSRA